MLQSLKDAQRPPIQLGSANPIHLNTYKNNARVHSKEQIKQIANSIKEFGFLNPILIDSQSFEIIAGHGRLEAAFTLGLESVPVIEVSHLSDAQKRAYTLIDNTLALNATWDDDVLRQELSNLALDDFDLSLLGMTNFPIKAEEDGEESEDSNDYEKNKPTKEFNGSKELDPKDFSEFDNKCPKCGFEFNNPKGH
jgi:hypothetical protein